MKSNVAADDAGHAKRWNGDPLNWARNSETCAVCCQVLQPVRGVHIAWVDHAFTPAVIPGHADSP